MPKVEYSLEAVNARLKAARTRVSIYKPPNAESLFLVATLPPKPGSRKPKPYQQRIALGISANPNGFRRAELEAQKLGSLLQLGQFDWTLYLEPEQLPENRPISELCKAFETHYMQTHSLQQVSWDTDQRRILRRLPQDQPLTLEILLAAVEATERNTRKRLYTCNTLQKLADFAGIKCDLMKFKGTYSATNTARIRDLPTDDEIIQWRNNIPTPYWQWVYGVMAAYGLRPHETFFCEFIKGTHELNVLKGKTGPRIVFAPLYPEWVDAWNLTEIQRPRIETDKYTNSALGMKIGTQLWKYKVPFPAYNLRHAYAIRASVVFGFPVTTSAALMGHSPTVHLRQYHKYISEATNREAVQRILQNSNRPTAPNFEG